MFTRRSLLAGLSAVIATAIAFVPHESIAAEPIKVVASFSILADMVKVVGGAHVQVKELVGPDGDAHVFQPTPADAKAVSEARLVVVNGLGLEGWMDRLFRSSGYKGTILVASKGVTPLRSVEEEEVPRSRISKRGGHGPSDTEALDPHAWQDLANGTLYVQNIIEGLTGADPQNAGDYQRAGAAYITEIAAMDARIKAAFALIPEAQRRAITSHDAFQYFGKAYGVEFIAPVGMSTEAEPSAGQVARLIRQMKQEGTRALFVENISDPRMIQQISRETNAIIGGTLYSDALSKPGQGGDTYLKMFENNFKKMNEAFSHNS
ncbi:MAG: metal transporter substrate-binding protein [Rhizobium sp.]|nr:metal transporter substrate-binding protein [Rhizobium sp.]